MFIRLLEFLNDVYGTTCLTKHTRNRFLCRRAQQVVDLFFFLFLQGGTDLLSCVACLSTSRFEVQWQRRSRNVLLWSILFTFSVLPRRHFDNFHERSKNFSPTFTCSGPLQVTNHRLQSKISQIQNLGGLANCFSLIDGFWASCDIRF